MTRNTLQIALVSATTTFGFGLSAPADLYYGNPNSGNSYDTTSVVSLHTAVAGGFSSEHSAARAAIQTIDGSSILSGPGDETDLHNNSTGAAGMWLGLAAGANPRGGTVAGSNWIAYDLGAVRPVDVMAIWNYGENGFPVFGMKNVTVEYSTTGSTIPGDWSVYFDGQIPQASGGAPSAAELVIENSVSAQYFVITSDTGIDGNWSAGAFTGQDGLSEVRFGVIPEPGTMVSMLIGGVLLTACRRRRS